jgi:hypothetical protein
MLLNLFMLVIRMAAQWHKFASDVEMPPTTADNPGQRLFSVRVEAPGHQPAYLSPETVSLTGDGEASVGSGPWSEPTAQPVRTTG